MDKAIQFWLGYFYWNSTNVSLTNMNGSSRQVLKIVCHNMILVMMYNIIVRINSYAFINIIFLMLNAYTFLFFRYPLCIPNKHFS